METDANHIYWTDGIGTRIQLDNAGVATGDLTTTTSPITI
jgi:hypothetical protein